MKAAPPYVSGKNSHHFCKDRTLEAHSGLIRDRQSIVPEVG